MVRPTEQETTAIEKIVCFQEEGAPTWSGDHTGSTGVTQEVEGGKVWARAFIVASSRKEQVRQGEQA